MNDLEIFINAPEGLTDSELAAYFDKACGSDTELRARVEALRAAGGNAGTEFLEKGPLKSRPQLLDDSTPLAEMPGDLIGNYKLLQQIGEGGFGVVYMAEQLKPVKRKVAMKIIKLGMDTKQVVARFEVERQALAMMDHPNIAKVHDAGSTDSGRPFFVMELVRGIPITEFCDGQSLTTDERLNLFIDVCHAVQHAHQKGVIHRDLKPSNVMVTLHDDKAVVKVIDFGVAKATHTELTDKTLYTRFEQFIGTPAYMSPEQAQISGLDIDTRSDIYALGVLLYELLTGATPFDAETLRKAGYEEICRIIREEDPPKPSTRIRTSAQSSRRNPPNQSHHTDHRTLCGDLDWIVMKALEKDRTRRYDTANSLAMDLNRHLIHEPVLARPPSTAYRIHKAWRRNKLAFTAASAVAVALIIGFTVSAWQATVAIQAKNEAQANEKKAVAAEGRVKEALDRAVRSASELREQVYVSDIGLAHRAVEDGDLGRAQALLSKHQPDPTEEDLRGFEWRHLWSRSQGNFQADLGPYVGLFSAVTISPDGQFVAVNRLHPARVEVIHLASGSVAKSIAMQDAVVPLAYSPSGNFLIGEMRGKIIGWDTRNWKAVEAVALTSPFAFGYRGDQEILVARQDDHLLMWNMTAWQSLGALENKEPEAPLLDPSYGRPWHMTNSVAVSSDRAVAYLAGASKIRRWDLNERTELPPLEITGIASLATASDGQLAGSDAIGNVLLIQPQSGEVLHTFKSHRSFAMCLKFTQDGTRLVSGSQDRNLVIHDPKNRSIVGRLLGHQGEVSALDISADGQTVVSGALNSRVLLWSPTKLGDESFDLGVIKTSSVLEDGRILMFRDNTNDLEYYDPVSSEVEPARAERLVRAMREIQAVPIAFSPTARWAVSIEGSKLAVWNVFTGDRERSLEHPSGSIGGAVFSPDGNYLVTGSGDSEVRLWQTRDWTSQPLGPKVLAFLNWAAFSRDRRRVAISGQDEKIKVYDFERGPREIALPSGAENLTSYTVALSNDGRWLASGSGGEIHVLDLESHRIAATLNGHVHGVFSLSFSPDDRTLVSSTGSRVIFWHVDTWQELMRFQDNVPPRAVFFPRMVFSPNGRYLARAGTPIGKMGTRFRIWQAPGFEEIADKDKR